MGVLIFSYRRQQIIAQKSRLNFKILQLHQKLMDLQTYAASVADGIVSFDDLTQAPSSIF